MAGHGLSERLVSAGLAMMVSGLFLILLDGFLLLVISGWGLGFSLASLALALVGLGILFHFVGSFWERFRIEAPHENETVHQREEEERGGKNEVDLSRSKLDRVRAESQGVHGQLIEQNLLANVRREFDADREFEEIAR